MIVVSDTAPLNYLVLCQAIDVLPKLYGEVYVPNAVISELQHPNTPAEVVQWLATTPPWLLIRDPIIVDPTIKLDAGETAAILLAEELHADRLLIDERPGVHIARSRGLTPLGTLGVPVEAAGAGYINLHLKVQMLETQTNFRMTPELKNLIFSMLVKPPQKRDNPPIP